MKAFEVFMLCLLFNFMIWIISSIGLFDADAYNPLSPSNLTFIGFMAFVGLLAGASILSYFFKSQNTAQTVVYSTFAAAFWAAYGNTLTLFSAMFSNIFALVPIFIVFTTIMTIVFITGFAQMVTGGWQSYA